MIRPATSATATAEAKASASTGASVSRRKISSISFMVGEFLSAKRMVRQASRPIRQQQPHDRIKNRFKKTSAQIFLPNKPRRPGRIPDERAQHPADLAAEEEIRAQPRQQYPARHIRPPGPIPQQRPEPDA